MYKEDLMTVHLNLAGKHIADNSATTNELGRFLMFGMLALVC